MRQQQAGETFTRDRRCEIDDVRDMGIAEATVEEAELDTTRSTDFGGVDSLLRFFAGDCLGSRFADRNRNPTI